MTPVEMPKANENMTEATLERWLVKEGDQVAVDGALCVIITDKASFDMPAPVAGTVRKILGPEKSLLPVGYILCALGAPAEAVPEEYETRNQETLTRHRGATVQTAGDAGGGPALAAGGGAVRATPAARRLAKEKGVDLAAVCKALCLNGPVNEKDISTYLERGNKAQQQQ